MDEQRFTIPNRLACYGEIIETAENSSKNRRHREEQNVQLVKWAISHSSLKKVFGSCVIRIKWVEPTPSRKPVEVAAGSIYIVRGLCEKGIIGGHMKVIGLYSEFAVNANNPRVEVTIEGAYGRE